MAEDAASKAYAAVTAKLDSWTSPKVGKLSANWRTYEESAIEWMETTMGPEPMAALTPQKRPAHENSPDTPVTSNSAKKPDRSVSPLNLLEIPTFPPIATATFATDDYHMYHDALWRYKQGKRSIEQRMDLAPTAAKNELAVDMDYLQTLAVDSNLWSLLAKLRSLGMDALWMDDTLMAKRQQQIALSDTFARLSRSPVCTHAHLIRNLYGETSSLLMQRRQLLVEWMQECAAQKEVTVPKPQSQMWPDSTKALQHNMQRSGKVDSIHPDAPLLVSESGEPLFGNDLRADTELLTACLQFILAGRLDKAMDLCKAQGQPWRAAIWQGGRPMEITSYANDETHSMVHVSLGNPERILWKSQCRKLAKKTWGAESAIYAILANDVHTALASPSLRTWEQGLQVCMTSLVGRLEDDLLHRYNGHLRKTGRTFPGSDYEQQEMEHLLATANVASLDEYTIFDTLEANPYKGMRAGTLLQKLIAAFIKGKTAVQQVLTSAWIQDTDKPLLRTMTHLLLYLDSLSSFRIDVPGLADMKNSVVLEYVRHLAANPPLTKYTTLYTSMLPTPTILEVFPTLLTTIQVPEERNLIWKQMKDLFENGVELDILKRVVRLILKDANSSDVCKCQSIGWLCFTPEHYGEALVCANELVRQLLLTDKSHVASEFLWDYFPTIVQEDTFDHVISAKREYNALLVYLEANAAFDRWKECMMEMFPESSPSTLNISALNEQEKGIARQMEKRRIVEEKREAGRKVIDAANVAQSKLDEVLTFDGGWLQEYEQDDDVDSPDEEKRQAELEKLQGRLIPQVVFLAHNVYSETATWMKTMLEDAIPVVGMDTKEVLCVLDEVGELSPFAPIYWLKHAHALANKVASEEYSVYDAFGEKDLQHFLELMEDVTIRVLEETAP